MEQKPLEPMERRQKELRLYYVQQRLGELRRETQALHDERLRLMHELGRATTTMKD